MLLYEYQVRDQLGRLYEYANNVQEKFRSGASAKDLLLDSKNLKQIYDSLNEMLPAEIRETGYCGQHIAYMVYHLERDSIERCRGDIDNICKLDIKYIEDAFRRWHAKQDHYDKELTLGVSSLVLRHELDSAVRKAFVILKTRLMKHFNAPDNLDGAELVNHIFGKKGSPGLPIDDSKKQAFRDLLAGLYGVFRHNYAHNDSNPSWGETEAVLSMINFILKRLNQLTKSRA